MFHICVMKGRGRNSEHKVVQMAVAIAKFQLYLLIVAYSVCSKIRVPLPYLVPQSFIVKTILKNLENLNYIPLLKLLFSAYTSTK